MARMTGGEAIVDGLLRHGIETVFGLPGVQVYGLFDALARNANRIRLINARHEQSTAYMALGYACASGRPSAYAVVPGPGVLNTTAALATAWGLNAPVLCLTGQVPSMMIGRGRGQLHELPDQLATLRSLLKYAERIEHTSQAPYLVARAFQEMRSGRPGPVALEMPWDQFGAQAEVVSQDPLPLVPAPVPDPERITALARMIEAARAPMIWVGGGALHAGAEVKALAERIGAPVVSFRCGRGVLDDRHPLGLTVAAAYKLLPETDLVIGIGTRLEVPTGRWPKLPPGLKIARLDIDPVEMRRLKVDLGVLCDSADGARALAEQVARREDRGRAAAIARVKEETAQAIQTVQPQMSFLEAIRDVLPEDGILCDEMNSGGLRIVVRLSDLCAAHADHVGVFGDAGGRVPDGAGGEGGAAGPGGGVTDRRRRIPVRSVGTGNGGAARDQPGDRAVQQWGVWERAAGSEAAVRRAAVRG